MTQTLLVPTTFRPLSIHSRSSTSDSGSGDSTLSMNSRRKGKGRGCAADQLLPEEEFWKQLYPWLLSAQYRLRRRYSPDWIPSWWDTDKPWTACEDGVTHRAQSLNVMDAECSKNRNYVVLKKASRSNNPNEVDVLQYFASPARSSAPQNHCVPILDALDVPQEEDLVIIVMPLLRRYDNPWFDTFGEAVECIGQLIDGLQFMHRNRVAHRNISRQNVMMDATELYPEGFHPRDISKSRDYKSRARHFTRTERPPKYYYTGFGKAKRYPGTGRVLDLPVWGFDKTVPEFVADPPRPCDPFATDVYYLGNMLKEDFLVMKKGFEFMEDLLEAMVHCDPAQRPDMDEVARRFAAIRRGLGKSKLSSRVVGRYDDAITDLVEGVPHWARRQTRRAAKKLAKLYSAARLGQAFQTGTTNTLVFLRL